MAYGFLSRNTSGFEQIQDREPFYRVRTATAISHRSSADMSALGGGLTYYYDLPGDWVSGGKMAFTRGAIGQNIAQAVVSGEPTWFEGAAISTIGLENGGGPIDMISAEYVNWPAPTGVGMRVRLANGTTSFSTEGTMLVLLATITVTLTYADLNVVKYINFSASPFGGLPYARYGQNETVMRVNATQARIMNIKMWFTSSTQIAYRMTQMPFFTNVDGAYPDTRPFTVTLVAPV